MIITFSNKMRGTFSWAMECKGVFLHEMDEAGKADFFISGRGNGIVISAFGKRNWVGRR